MGQTRDRLNDLEALHKAYDDLVKRVGNVSSGMSNLKYNISATLESLDLLQQFADYRKASSSKKAKYQRALGAVKNILIDLAGDKSKVFEFMGYSLMYGTVHNQAYRHINDVYAFIELHKLKEHSNSIERIYEFVADTSRMNQYETLMDLLKKSIVSLAQSHKKVTSEIRQVDELAKLFPALNKELDSQLESLKKLEKNEKKSSHGGMFYQALVGALTRAKTCVNLIALDGNNLSHDYLQTKDVVLNTIKEAGETIGHAVVQGRLHEKVREARRDFLQMVLERHQINTEAAQALAANQRNRMFTPQPPVNPAYYSQPASTKDVTTTNNRR